PFTEVPMSTGILAGTADVLSEFSDEEVRILDFKSGYKQKTHAHQLRGYSWLALARRPMAIQVRICTFWLQSGNYENELITRADLEKWYEQLLDLVAYKKHFNPGWACEYCPRAHDCPAIVSYLKQAVDVALSPNLNELSAANLADTYTKL